jgi:hypothetical protein
MPCPIQRKQRECVLIDEKMNVRVFMFATARTYAPGCASQANPTDAQPSEPDQERDGQRQHRNDTCRYHGNIGNEGMPAGSPTNLITALTRTAAAASHDSHHVCSPPVAPCPPANRTETPCERGAHVAG